jgi:Ca-activated chloride channel family protein
MRHLATASLVVLLALTVRAPAAGLLAPTDETLPPLRVTDHLVDVRVHDGVALTTVTQTFRNDTKRRLEATYLFPLPEHADLTDFRMSFDGKMVTGEVLPAEEAARKYESIVRQMKDPGLIEFIGRRLLQMRIFPVEPESDTTIELRYQQICRPVSGMRAYHYPLRTRKTAGQAYGTVRFALDLETAAPLKNVWSPTHAVEIVRDDDERSARIGYEAAGGSLEDDFLLLFSTDSSDLGLSVVAAPPDDATPGHFVLMLTPRQLWPNEERPSQDVVFVLDTSGSMAGDKIDQARRALAYCVDQLDDEDRFTVVRFSTGFDELPGGLSAASKERRAAAREWIDGFAAAGGTNISDTLAHVVALERSRAAGETRPFVVVFLTDGRGNRKAEEIMNRLADADAGRGLRVFPFGVGHDVNTNLLDRLADAYTGRPTYVQPGEQLELVLGDFFSVVSRPVLTDLRLELPEIGATERFPATLGDLYHGQQIIVAGRYAEAMSGRVRLSALRGGERVEYAWKDVSFAGTKEATYVAPIWAGRKIAFLIDQIRRHGESSEMVAEVLALSQEYGIQTPYTSWFVNPEAGGDRRGPPRRGVTPMSFQQRGRVLERLRAEGAVAADAPPAPGGAGFGLGSAGGGGGGGGGGYGDEFDSIDLLLAGQSVTKEAGKVANLIARKNAALRELRTLDDGRLDADLLPGRRIGETWFNRLGTLWVDDRFAEDTAIVTVRFASEAYFELVRARADLREALASGRDVIVLATPETAVLVSDRVGIETFSQEEREHLGLGHR